MKRYILILLLATISLLAKSDESVLEILSPKDGVEVDYNYITLKVKTTGIYRVSAKNISLSGDLEKYFGYQIEGIKNQDDYFLYNMPLQKGKNEIEVTIRLKDNLPSNNGNYVENANSLQNKATYTKLVTIYSTSNEIEKVAVGVDISPKRAYLEIEATIKTYSNIENIQRYYYDFDGDGNIDQSSNKEVITKKFKEGSFKPIVTIETDNGLFFSTQKSEPLIVGDDNTPPEIKFIVDNPLVINVGENLPNLRDIIKVTDDKDNKLSFTISGYVDSVVAGDYNLTYTARDNFGNNSKAILQIKVKEEYGVKMDNIEGNI